MEEKIQGEYLIVCFKGGMKMLNCCKRMLGLKISPTAEEVGDLLNNCERLISRLETVKQEDKKLLEVFNLLKNNFTELKKVIKLKDNSLDKEDWDKKQEDDKIKIYVELNSIFKTLTASNRCEILVGKLLFVIFAATFIALIICYLYLHNKINANNRTPKINVNTIVEIEKAFKIMEDQIGLFSEGSKENTKNSRKNSEEPGGKAAAQKSFEDGFIDLKNILINEPLSSRLSFKLKKTLGVLEGEKSVKKVNKEKLKETLDELKKIIEAEIESLSTQFFWVATPGKWYEITFWSLFGVLVGILYFIAGSLGKGIFNMSDITMMIAEIIITPPVVLIVFFLFPFTDIKTFTPSELSIYMTMGISFILGFAIRRTVGLLDNIKRRLLPDPPNEGAGK
jgi:hypothetical protein